MMATAKKRYRVGGPYPPLLWPRHGKLYAGSGSTWLKVPPKTKLAQIDWDGESSLFEKRPKVKPVIRYRTVRSKSNPRHKYVVTFENGRVVNCTCPGFGYRRYCKHTKLSLRRTHATA